MLKLIHITALISACIDKIKINRECSSADLLCSVNIKLIISNLFVEDVNCIGNMNTKFPFEYKNIAVSFEFEDI